MLIFTMHLPNHLKSLGIQSREPQQVKGYSQQRKATKRISLSVWVEEGYSTIIREISASFMATVRVSAK